MATAARDRLARTLRGDVQAAFSVELTAKTDDLSLDVEGYGPVKLPVTPAKARKLAGLGSPARFGRGEETLTDPDVRDTWEIPQHLVLAEWDSAALNDILATVKEELGLPNGAALTADLHSLLVYEPDQFFLSHQDSEKDDSMVGTLVVTLPSSYTGGELVVSHNEERKAYRGLPRALSLVAFYADCRHEVLPVKSGYRITLTYNLLLHGVTSRPEGDDGTAAEVADLLREHFSMPVPRYDGGPVTDPPNRLVYLLDHEYTPRGLTWQRLKGADTRRVSLLRTAAGQADCETVLALADIRTTHGASPAREGYGYRDQGWYGDYDVDDSYAGDANGREGEYDIHGLVDSEVTVTHWTGPDGTRLEETSLYVDSGEVCASTPADDLAPYSSQYEGYMGNWGNTLDRWYHRAAVIVWPREQAFANRAETSPAWALDEIAAMASAGDVPGARTAAATLAPFWDTALGSRQPAAGGQGQDLRDLRPGAAGSGRRSGRIDRGDAAAPVSHRGSRPRVRGAVRDNRRPIRPAVDGGTATDVVRRASAGLGLRRRTATATVGGGPAARPVRAAARRRRRGRDGRAATRRAGVGVDRQGHRRRARVVVAQPLRQGTPRPGRPARLGAGGRRRDRRGRPSRRRFRVRPETGRRGDRVGNVRAARRGGLGPGRCAQRGRRQ